jgi:hypothetical protein
MYLTAVTTADGTFVFSKVPPGFVTVAAQLTGFVTGTYSLAFDQQPRQIDFVLPVAAVTETVTVAAESPASDRRRAMQQSAAPSQNVINLQHRTAGVAGPSRRRAGTSHEFVAVLVAFDQGG